MSILYEEFALHVVVSPTALWNTPVSILFQIDTTTFPCKANNWTTQNTTLILPNHTTKNHAIPPRNLQHVQSKVPTDRSSPHHAKTLADQNPLRYCKLLLATSMPSSFRPRRSSLRFRKQNARRWRLLYEEPEGPDCDKATYSTGQGRTWLRLEMCETHQQDEHVTSRLDGGIPAKYA